MNKLKILVVDDEVIIARLLQKILSELGYEETERCKSHLEAKQLIESGQFGLVILDINLSIGLEGIALGELCHQLNIPYFFLTSYSDAETFRKAKSHKPGSYVIKPFDKNEIMVAVELTLLDSPVEGSEKIDKAAKYFKLSKREEEILHYTYEKLTNEEISQKLSLSHNTIKYHLRHIFNKMAASSKIEVIQRVEDVWKTSY